jgi:hypothetical protein
MEIPENELADWKPSGYYYCALARDERFDRNALALILCKAAQRMSYLEKLYMNETGHFPPPDLSQPKPWSVASKEGFDDSKL